MSQVAKPPVSNEYDLGQSINVAAASGNSDTFRLLLSMLSTDVCDQPQFGRLPTDDKPSQDLRQALQLADEQPFYDQHHPSYQSSLTQAFHSGGLTDVRLLHALRPEPLVAGSEPSNPVNQLQTLLSPWQQYKIAGNDAEPCPQDWQQADQALLAIAANA
nr:VC2046/SO_2500 family protein [Neiella litorisoli]